ncbi:glycerophosphodiester phosphodiesterase family protein [Thorsellia anophelis]|uniref:Glycerophosphoryl diester phosphodiesterase n=1 Tax=Thorsellia anophelis DSM 18579 TaxID=1123402 RepID=A0A1H9ZHW0_9GAMM|nr:glycerophosphodiester phosphodiesterase family protein [Thorsellia anophelis]SES81156.1 glycerophosphoryl diester phosphodiesterase [Thorsellia anophelis DSM 18579]
MKRSKLSLCLSIVLTSIILVGCNEDTEVITVEPKLAPVKEPLVIAHRGASGYLPEHTLAAYELAVKMGADYIEPDLQLTSDGVLVAVHDDTLARTTNVIDVFGSRDGDTNVGKYTLEEIKQLDMKLVSTAALDYPEFTPTSEDALKVPTFEEVIELAQRLSKETGREIGIYPEAKLQDDLQEDLIIETLDNYGYTADSKVYIQSFSADTLRSLKNKMENRGYLLPLVQLGSLVDQSFNESTSGASLGLTCEDYCVLTSDNPRQVIRLAEIKEYAPDIGVSLSTSASVTSTKSWPLYTPELYTYAHELGMTVTGWTFSKPSDNAQAISEYLGFYELGMDGVFSNYPDLAIKARDIFISNQERKIQKAQ